MRRDARPVQHRARVGPPARRRAARDPDVSAGRAAGRDLDEEVPSGPDGRSHRQARPPQRPQALPPRRHAAVARPEPQAHGHGLPGHLDRRHRHAGPAARGVELRARRAGKRAVGIAPADLGRRRRRDERAEPAPRAVPRRCRVEGVIPREGSRRVIIAGPACACSRSLLRPAPRGARGARRRAGRAVVSRGAGCAGVGEQVEALPRGALPVRDEDAVGAAVVEGPGLRGREGPVKDAEVGDLADEEAVLVGDGPGDVVCGEGGGRCRRRGSGRRAVGVEDEVRGREHRAGVGPRAVDEGAAARGDLDGRRGAEDIQGHVGAGAIPHETDVVAGAAGELEEALIKGAFGAGGRRGEPEADGEARTVKGDNGKREELRFGIGVRVLVGRPALREDSAGSPVPRTAVFRRRGKAGWRQIPNFPSSILQQGV